MFALCLTAAVPITVWPNHTAAILFSDGFCEQSPGSGYLLWVSSGGCLDELVEYLACWGLQTCQGFGKLTKLEAESPEATHWGAVRDS